MVELCVLCASEALDATPSTGKKKKSLGSRSKKELRFSSLAVWDLIPSGPRSKLALPPLPPFSSRRHWTAKSSLIAANHPAHFAEIQDAKDEFGN